MISSCFTRAKRHNFKREFGPIDTNKNSAFEYSFALRVDWWFFESARTNTRVQKLTSFQGAFCYSQLKMNLQIAPDFLPGNISSQKPPIHADQVAGFGAIFGEKFDPEPS